MIMMHNQNVRIIKNLFSVRMALTNKKILTYTVIFPNIVNLPVVFERWAMGASGLNLAATIGTFYFGLLSGIAFMAMKPTPTTGMLMTIPLAFDFAAIAGGILDFTKIPNLISKYGLGAGIALTVVLIDIITCATIFVISDLGYIYSAFVGGD